MEAEVINKVREQQIIDKRMLQIPAEELQLHLEVENALIKAHVFNARENEILGFQTTNLNNEYYEFDNDKLQSFFSSSALQLNRKFQKISLSVVNHKCVLVPSALFERDKASDYLNTSCTLDAFDTVMTKEIPFLNAIAVFAVPDTLKKLMDKQFEHIEYLPHVVPTYLLLYNLYKSEKEALIFVNIHSDFYDIIVFQNGQLKLFTTHPVETTEDFLYYTFYTLEQMKISAATTPVYLTGEVEKNSAIHEILLKYFKKSSWILKASPYKMGYELNSINPYFYCSHFSQYLCV
ncbi:MAG: DUF3822 family protein [Flavobacteriales bacterium]